jgi:hypothetical protein
MMIFLKKEGKMGQKRGKFVVVILIGAGGWGGL